MKTYVMAEATNATLIITPSLANSKKVRRYSLKGKPYGKGIYTWSNGEIYDGEWANGLKHGSGVWRGKK